MDYRGSQLRKQLRSNYRALYEGRAEMMREHLQPTPASSRQILSREGDPITLHSRGQSQRQIDDKILNMEAAWMASSSAPELEMLARSVRGKQVSLPKRLQDTSNFNKDEWIRQGLDAKWRALRHKRRPTIRRIKGSNWRLAGTAHSDNTYPEQLAISQALAQAIRSAGAKARVIKWKEQVGVYYQPRLDPIEHVWGSQWGHLIDSNTLRTKKPASFEWKPAIYGRKKMPDPTEVLLGQWDKAREHLQGVCAGTRNVRDSYAIQTKRKLLVLREPGYESNQEQYGMTNGISLGWVTRAEAAQIMAERGIYPLGSEFDRVFRDEELAGHTASGLKAAEFSQREREMFKDSMNVVRDYERHNLARPPWQNKITSTKDIPDYSWTVLSEDDVLGDLIDESTLSGDSALYSLYNKIDAIGVGEMGPQLDAVDLHNAYHEFLVEDGLHHEEIGEILQDTALCELEELFHCERTAERLSDNSRKSLVQMEKITGFRDGKELGEWNEFEPLKTKIWLKPSEEIDWDKPGVKETAKKILWNTEFEDHDRSTFEGTDFHTRLSQFTDHVHHNPDVHVAAIKHGPVHVGMVQDEAERIRDEESREPGKLKIGKRAITALQEEAELARLLHQREMELEEGVPENVERQKRRMSRRSNPTAEGDES